MTTFSSKFNNGNSARFDVDTKDFTFVKVAELPLNKGKKPAVYKVDGMYIKRGKEYGDQPVFILAETKQMVNMPSHMTARVQAILADDEAVQDIKDGKVGFTMYEYESHGKQCRGVEFVDL